MSTFKEEFISKSPEQTRAFAREFAREFVKPDSVIALKGGLGAGKTCFAQGLAWGLGVDEGTYLSSPTFALVKEYRGRVGILHIDLYRISSAAEAFDAGIEECLMDGDVVIVEWPEKIGRVLCERNLITVDIEAISQDERRIRIHTGD
jgi:tRNA threonylcarbamoyladenosine biosynthesis protein TsaE